MVPGWTAGDVAGSAYCIAAYDPDPRIGTWEDLADVRAKLHARGMQLMVDFVPNHTGFDHPWVSAHPERYVKGPPKVARPPAVVSINPDDGQTAAELIDQPDAFQVLPTPVNVQMPEVVT